MQIIGDRSGTLNALPASVLTPGPERPIRELLADVRPHERAPADRPFVFVAMIATVDGRAARDGSSAALGGEADLEMLLELRALADAVLIGTGTLAAEGYDRLIRAPERRARRRAAGLAEDPLAVLLTRGFHVPWEAGLFQAPEQPVLIGTGAGGAAADVPAPVEVVQLPEPTPAALLAELRARGVRSLLCESGPTLHGALQAAGLVDELFLTVAPLLTGDDEEPPIVAGGRLPEPIGMELIWALRHGSELFLRYAV
jgi:riboflavin biosynthesis pyrimidine reductase